jgi:hypothetical protein
MGPVGGVACESITLSGFEKEQPNGHCPQDHHAKVNQTRRTQMNVELEANQYLASDDGQHQTEHDANQPGGEIRAEEVYCGRMRVNGATTG